MVLHLHTAKEPSPRNLSKFLTKPKLVSQNITQTSRFCNKFYRFRTKLRGLVYFLQNQFRFWTKLKKLPQRRFFRCIQVKNHFRYCRIFLLHFSTFQLIWKLFDGFEKKPIFQSVAAGCVQSLLYLTRSGIKQYDEKSSKSGARHVSCLYSLLYSLKTTYFPEPPKKVRQMSKNFQMR